jgi:hypothetical protein
VLVDRELVVLVELQQTPRVLHRRDDFFEISQLVQHTQRLRGELRHGQQIHEPLRDGGRDFLAAVRRGEHQRGGRGVIERFVLADGQIDDPQDFLEIAGQFGEARAGRGDLPHADPVVALNLAA